MYYCYSGFRSYLIKILAKKNIENDLHSCVVLCHCQCVYCTQCTANKITTSRTLDRLNGMRFVRYFFYSIALGIYTMPQTHECSRHFLCSNFHFIFQFKNLSVDLFRSNFVFRNSLQLLVVFYTYK